MAENSILSIDVEDYYQVEAFSDIVDRSRWDAYPRRVEANTKCLLHVLEQHHARATFFILGWVAERHPALVREIVERGHEPACHSYEHRLVYTLTPREFREDTSRARDLVEQAAGRAIYGYRAPSYSVTTRALWALEILAELGFTYDSSIFPIRHDVYGIPRAPRHPFRVSTASGPLVEYPITTFRLWGGHNLPVGGGGYLRLLPFWYTRLGLGRAEREGLPLIVYLHPWEIDPGQPRLPGRLRSRLRHYTGLETARARLERLLAGRTFTSFERSGLDSTAVELDLHGWLNDGRA